MAWYAIINATRESFVADRDAEISCATWPRPYRPTTARWEAEGLYGLTPHGARRSSVSLSPEAVARAERMLTSYDATALTARPTLMDMEKRRQR